MAINYIKGESLAANLLRGGVDLAVETDLLYVDVANGRIGIQNATPGTTLDITGTVSAMAVVTPIVTVGNVIISNNNITTSIDDLTLTSATTNVSLLGDLTFNAPVSDITGQGDLDNLNNQSALTIVTTLVDTPYYLGNARDAVSIGSDSVIAAASSLYLTPDGLTIFYVDNSGAGTIPVDVYQSTLGVAFDLSTAGVPSFTTITGGAITEAAHAVTFNINGLEMYISKYTNAGVDTIVEKFTLSLAFDLSSTVTYIGNIVLGAGDAFNFAPTYSADGLKAYNAAIDTAGIFINEYDLSPAYDLTTAVFNGNFDISTEIVNTTNYITTAMSTDGFTVFAAQYAATNNVLVSYALGTALDITTAVELQTVTPATTAEVQGIWFPSDGFNFYWLDDDGVLLQFDSTNKSPNTTSTALNFSGAGKLITTDDGVQISGQLILPGYATASIPATTIAGGLIYDTDTNSLKVYNGNDWTAIAGGGSGGGSGGGMQGWNLSTATNASKSFSVAGQLGEPTDLAISEDGTKVYITDFDGVAPGVYQYNLTTAWDFSTASYSGNFASTIGNGDFPLSIAFNRSGTKMFIGSTNEVHQHTLSPAWELSGANPDLISYTIGAGVAASAIAFNPAGTVLLVLDDTTRTVTQHTMTLPYDVENAVASGLSGDVFGTVNSGARGLSLSPDGYKMYVSDGPNEEVYEYQLTTAHDPSTLVYTNRALSTTAIDGDIGGIFFRYDGNRLYMVGTTTDAAYQFDLAWHDEYSLATQDYVDTTSVSIAGDAMTGALTTTGGVDSLTTATTVVNVAAAAAPTVGQVLTATSDSLATWQDAAGGDPASETVSGTIEIATQIEVDTGTDAVRAVTPATLQKKAEETAMIMSVVFGI